MKKQFASAEGGDDWNVFNSLNWMIYSQFYAHGKWVDNYSKHYIGNTLKNNNSEKHGKSKIVG